ncbi:unnamed protein product [Boreogadus saida]
MREEDFGQGEVLPPIISTTDVFILTRRNRAGSPGDLPHRVTRQHAWPMRASATGPLSPNCMRQVREWAEAGEAQLLRGTYLVAGSAGVTSSRNWCHSCRVCSTLEQMLFY